MGVISLRYQFRQSFRAPARGAYTWCTDFGPGDGRLFLERTRRRIHRLTEDALIMTDTTYPRGRPLRIQRLVRLDPRHLAWTNTHLDGPYRFSQHWYRIRSDGPRRSHLEFEGLRLERLAGRASAAEVARRAEARRREDSEEWRNQLAPALEADVRARTKPRR